LPEYGGILKLGPPLLLLASLSLDPEGKGSLPLDIPASPPLAGSEVHFQARVHPPLGLSGSVLSDLGEGS
jgi:hypothetical protein